MIRTGARDAAIAQLRALAQRTGARAAAAAFLLADLATDDGRESEARAAYRALAATSPRTPLAGTARFRAAMIAYAGGASHAAAVELDSLIASDRDGEDCTDPLELTHWPG